MASYAPYDNVAAVDYPPILAETSLNDTRVLYVEPAKWVARLRADRGRASRLPAPHRDVGRPRRRLGALQVLARPGLLARLDPRPDGPGRGRPRDRPEKSLRVRRSATPRAAHTSFLVKVPRLTRESDGHRGRCDRRVGGATAPPPTQRRGVPWQHVPHPARTREIEGRDSVGLYLDEIARNPLLDAAAEVELSKTIEAGLMAEHLLAEGRVGRKKGGAPMSATQEELEWLAEEGRKAVDDLHQRQPAPGRLDRPQVRPGPDADARPDPGGQHRPDPGGREVRLHQGLQVLDVRHLVGAPGDHPRHRAAGPRRPAARARGRGAQPGRRRPPYPRAPARPRPRPAGDRRRARHGPSTGSST